MAEDYEFKPMNRAERRHHQLRKKAQRRFYYGRDLRDSPRHWGIAVHTPVTCSRAPCGNPRKHFRQKSLKELRDIQLASLY